MQKREYDPVYASIEERIAHAGWFHGTERDWQALPVELQEQVAFAATGCAVAYPTWHGPVDCCHVGCRILRHELPKIAELNSTMRSETANGWWRFISRNTPEGRRKLALLYRHYRKLARQQGEYDLWKLGGTGVAMVGVLG